MNRGCKLNGNLIPGKSAHFNVTKSGRVILKENNADYCNRVIKRDVIKLKFVKLWDSSRYSERKTPKTPTCQKLAIAQLCPDNSVQILLNLTWV